MVIRVWFLSSCLFSQNGNLNGHSNAIKFGVVFWNQPGVEAGGGWFGACRYEEPSVSAKGSEHCCSWLNRGKIKN